MSKDTQIIIGQVTRLRVFSFLKQFMDDTGRSPTVTETSVAVGIPAGTARRHMAALDGADGLPLSCRPLSYTDLDDLPPGRSGRLSTRRQGRMGHVVDEAAAPVDMEIVL